MTQPSDSASCWLLLIHKGICAGTGIWFIGELIFGPLDPTRYFMILLAVASGSALINVLAYGIYLSAVRHRKRPR